MWPALFFTLLVVIVIAEAIWREHRIRRQRQQAKAEFTAKLLAQQQEAYAQAQAQQRALFNSMVDGVMLLDEHGTVQLVNSALQQLFRLSASVSPGQNMSEVIDLPGLAGLASRLQTEESVVGWELAAPGPPPRFLEVNASSVRGRMGEYRGAIFVFHDLTRVKQLEDTRKEFVANVSHELRTPLSLIKGFVETLLDGAHEPELLERYLRTIQKHADRLAFLIEDLLSLSQLESGRATLNLTAVRPHDIAARVFEDLRARAQEREVTLENRLPDDLIAHADADRLQQILTNLVENGIKYGRRLGMVQVGGFLLEDGMVEIWVRDDGPGIPIEAQSRIFERFYRVDKARSRSAGGTGLGLAIVKHMVYAHAGRVWVKSEPGHGATFHFTLPSPISGAP